MQPNENRPQYQLRPGPLLDRRGVQHNTNRSTERLRGERRGELGADDAGVACAEEKSVHVVLIARGSLPLSKLFEHTVRPGDLAPDHADLGAADLPRCAVDVGDLLAQVEATWYSQYCHLAEARLWQERTWQHWCHRHPQS